jgi:hypothetical protein
MSDIVEGVWLTQNWAWFRGASRTGDWVFSPSKSIVERVSTASTGFISGCRVAPDDSVAGVVALPSLKAQGTTLTGTMAPSFAAVALAPALSSSASRFREGLLWPPPLSSPPSWLILHAPGIQAHLTCMYMFFAAPH